MNSSDLLQDLAIPYVSAMSSVEQNGTWLRRAEYPELPGCVVESVNALDCIENLEECRVRMIVAMHNAGERPPRPRPPLKSGLAGLGSIDLDELLADALDGRL